jgi:hypothetical protein
MREHYSTVDLEEKRAAVVSVLRLLPAVKGGSADGGGDAGAPANDATEADAAKAAK